MSVVFAMIKKKVSRFSFISYFPVFVSVFGIRSLVVVILTLVATFLEGIGIIMLLPLFESLDDSASLPSNVSPIASSIAGLGLADNPIILLLVVGLFFLLKGLTLFLADIYKSFLKANLQKQIKSNFAGLFQEMRYEYFASRDSGFFSDLVNAQSGRFVNSGYTFLSVLALSVSALAYAGLAFTISWKFALTAVAFGMFLALFFVRINKRLKDISRQHVSESGRLAHYLIQNFQAFKYLKATGQFERFGAQVVGSISAQSILQRKTDFLIAVATKVREPIAVLSVVVILLIQLKVFDQPLGPMLVSILLFYRSLTAIFSVQSLWASFSSTVGSLEVVVEEMETLRAWADDASGLDVDGFDNQIEFRNVSFKYSGSDSFVLNDLSLTIEKHASIALVGASGAGKSTIADLVSMLITPTSGSILIDGVSSTAISKNSWCGTIGFVTQEPVVFNDTIAKNICSQSEFDECPGQVMGRIQEAARQAGISEYIEQLPNGYQTLVGDRGINLSGGQRQRLCVARELFRRPQLLILDEATSALDSESELVVSESIKALKGSVTVVLIAHRYSTVRDADLICVIDQGRLVESGSFDELCKRPGSRFSEMVRLQLLNKA